MVLTEKIDFSSDLTRNGLKTTKHRTEILNILAESDRPLAAEQIFLGLKKREISVNLSTVYRVLEVLSDKNLTRKVNIPGESKTLYEYNRRGHRHYLICLGCNRVVAINHCPLEEYEKSLAKETNYFISGHKLDIYGYCPKCREKYARRK